MQFFVGADTNNTVLILRAIVCGAVSMAESLWEFTWFMSWCTEWSRKKLHKV